MFRKLLMNPLTAESPKILIVELGSTTENVLNLVYQNCSDLQAKPGSQPSHKINLQNTYLYYLTILDKIR